MINNNEQSISHVNLSNILTNLNSILPNSSHTLDAAFLDAQDLLRAFAIDRNAQAQIVATAFGPDIDKKALAKWVQPWGQRDFSGLPAIEIRSDSELDGALGVYAAATDMIYLNEEFIVSAPHAQIVAVMLEEIGHGLDARINAVDAPGDEGAIFAALVLGETLSASQLQALKQEDDLATIVIDGQVLSVEQATAPVNSLNFQQIGSDIDGEAPFDFSGISVSLSADGSVVAIGATGNDDNGDRSGHVRLYENNEGAWQQIGNDIDGEAGGDFSGDSVSLSADGSVVAIGASRNDGNGDRSGHVRLYENNDGTWQQIGSDIDGEAAGDISGFSVSLSADGSVVAIGTPGNDGNGNGNGHVRLYENNDGTWQQIGSDIDGEAERDNSGWSVSLSADGSVVAIGAIFNDDNGLDSGHVRLYENNDGIWQQIGNDIDGEAEFDFSGDSVSLSADGSVVAIGTALNNGNGVDSGHVRLYENNGGTWQQIGSDIDGEAEFDFSGESVSLSADGSIVAIGADRNDGNGNLSGHVRLYENNGGTWQQIGSDIDGEAVEDLSGNSVSLSADGSVVAIGAPRNDGNGNFSGHVRLYQVGQRGAENTPLALAGLSVSDVDGDLATTQLSVANGNLTVDLSGGATISAGANGSGSLTLSGSEAEINAALATLVYQGNLNFNGRDTLTMVSTDSAGTPLSDTDTLPITIASANGVNNPPIALDDGIPANPAFTTDEDTAFTTGNVLSNDSDPEGDALTVVSIGTSGTLGTVIDNGDGTFDYDPNGQYRALNNGATATDSFTYTISDGNGETASTATVNITINGINHAPVNSLSLIQQIGSDIDGEARGDESGGSVSLSADGSVVAIGAPGNDGNGSSSGHVRLYENNGGTWQQIGNDIDGEAERDFSGNSVSLSADGSVVAIGAFANDGNGINSGHVRLYENNGGAWQQIGSDIDGEAERDFSGNSVSLSADGSVVAIGAPTNDGNGISSGHVRLYENNDGIWQQIGNDIDGEAAEDFSSDSVSLSADGSVVAIGADNNDGNGDFSGHVRLYENNGGTWQQIGSDIDGEAAEDLSGNSVSLSADGSVVAIGAILNDGNGSGNGHVRLYENNDGTWQQIGSDIDGEAIGDQSGRSVSLSADGSVVAIGAVANAGNGFDSGHVRLYENNDGTWQQIGSDIDGEATGDFSGGGRSVSLSADGSVVAIGAPGNDGNGGSSGHVRLYQVGQRGVEDTPLALAGLSVSDADGDLATTQLSVANGNLSVDLSGGATISAGTNSSGNLTLSGSEAQINAALATLVYQGNLNFSGRDTLTMVSTDSSETPLSDTDTLPIIIVDAPDASAPLLVSSNPPDDSIDFLIDNDIRLNFNENVTAGSGNIVISNDSDTRTIDINDTSQVTFSKGKVTVNPADDLIPNTSYNIQLASGVITDTADNAYAGINDPDTLNFTTIPTDPVLDFSIPFDGSTFQIDHDIGLFFNEDVTAGSGDIIISNGSDTRTIDINDASQVTFDGFRGVTINPLADLLPNTTYNIQMAGSVITDTSGNAYAGISDPDTLNFTTIPSNPVLSFSDPFDGSTFQIDHDIRLFFNETITAGSGDIIISNGTDTRTIDINDASQVTFDGFNGVVINPAADLMLNTTYNIQMASGVITDTAGNTYAGISDPTILNFTTIPTDPLLDFSDPFDGSTFQIDHDIGLFFNEAITTGSGDIIISNGTDTRTIDINDTSQVTFSKDGVFINPVADLIPNTSYNIQLASGVITDTAGNAYAGISDPTILNFTTIPSNPVLSFSDPFDGSTFQIDHDIGLFFNEAITAGSGDIIISNGTDTRTIDINDASQVTFDGFNGAVINPAADLMLNTTYSIQMASGVITDTVGNAYAGISDPDTLNFTTTPTDPLLDFSNPSDDSTFQIDHDIGLFFNEDVTAGSGDIIISNGSDTHTIDINDTSQVTFSKGKVTVNPADDLIPNTSYNIQLASGVITDTAGNAYAGISDPDTLNFTTIPIPPNEIFGTTGRDILTGTPANDIISSLAGNIDRMSGGAGADIFVIGAEAVNGIRERDIILDYEVDVDAILLEDGASVGSIRQTSSGVTVFLEGDRDAIFVQGDGVLVGNLTFIPEDILLG